MMSVIRDAPDEDGFSVLELVMALSVLAIFTASLAITIGTGLNLTRQDRNRSVAANLAAQEMDSVRSADFTSLPLGLVTSTQTVDGVAYTLTRQSEWVATNATGSACDSGGTSPSYLRVTVGVTWPEMRGADPLKQTTVIAPPVGSYDATNGHISVRVLDRDGQPQPGVPVRAQTTGYDQTIDTTTDGCAFFAYVAPGTYTVTLTETGYVDRQSLASPSQSVAVTSGHIISVAFDYDQAAQLSLTLTAPDNGAMPAAIPVAIGNSALLPNGTKTYAGSGLTRTLTNLFPALDGYEVWAGSCADADPEGKNASTGTAYWPGAQRQAALDVTPGNLSTGQVTVASRDIVVQKNGVGQSGLQVKAIHASDSGCATGETYTLGTTDVNGALRIALPYGTWTMQAVGKSPKTSWPQAVVSPLDTGVLSTTLSIQ